MRLNILALICGLVVVNAHIYLSSVTINGVLQMDCLRPLGTNSPLTSVTGPEMMCGFLPQGSTAAKSKCTIEAGSKIGLQWNHNAPGPQDDIIDPSHKGPCMVYLSSDNGVSWFKIWEMGYSTSADWCVIDLIANRGYMEVTIPSDIAPGAYLVRGEIIALHEAFREGGAQPYVDCAELQISGSGNAKPATVKLPGAYTPTDPGILFNIYNTPNEQYVIPGPPVYVARSGSGGGGNSNGGNPVPGNGTDINVTPVGNGGGSGMSVGGQAVLSLFLIAFAAALACGIFFYHRDGQLLGYKMEGYHVVKARPSAGPDEVPRGGNYVAYVDNL